MTNADAFRLGYLLAQGNDPPAAYIEEIAAFGYVPPVILPGYEPLMLMMASKHRTLIAREAIRRGVDLRDLASMAMQAVAMDDLFGAVL